MAVVTKTLKPSGGDYTSLSAWQAGEQTDLVSADDSHVLECDAARYTGAVDITGWTTGASNRITIKAAAGHEHDGVIGAGVEFYSAATGDTFILDLTSGYITLEDIEAYHDAFRCAVDARHEGVIIQRCILRGEGTTGLLVGGGIQTGGGLTTPPEVYSSIIQLTRTASSVGALRHARGSGSVPTFYNCTFVGTTGVYASGDSSFDGPKFRNCAFPTDSEAFDAQGGAGTLTFPANTSHNAFWGAQSSFGTDAVTGIGSSDFIDFAADDFSIDATSSLYDAGTDLSAEFTEDIQGNTITTWSIGAFQVAGGGGATTTPVSPDSTATGTASLTLEKILSKLLNLTSTGTSSLSVQKTFNNSHEIEATPTASVTRNIKVIKDCTALSTTDLSKTIQKTLEATVSSAADHSKGSVLSVSLEAVAVASAELQQDAVIGYSLEFSVEGSPSVIKAVSLDRSSDATGTSDYNKKFFVESDSSVTGTPESEQSRIVTLSADFVVLGTADNEQVYTAGPGVLLEFETLAEFIFSKSGLEGNFNDRLQAFLQSKGYSGETVNDSFYQYLEDNDFTGALSDKYYKVTKETRWLWDQ